MEKSFNLALKLKVDAFKVHSEDFFNNFFIAKVIKTKKPVLISTGGTHRSELFDLILWLNKKTNFMIIFICAWYSSIPNTNKSTLFK